jgi:sulfatase-like protein
VRFIVEAKMKFHTSKDGVGKGKANKSFIQAITRFFERGLFAPFLLSIQPVLQLFLINVAELDFSEIIRSLFAALLFGSIIFAVLYLFMRDWIKSGLVASLFILLFFLFGDVADWIVKTFGLGPVRANFFILALVAVIMIVWFWVVRSRIRNTGTLNLYFNLLSVLFLISSVIQMRNYLIQNGVSLKPAERPIQVAVVQSTNPRPDIYYIILDAYGRNDVLQTIYDFDDSGFLNALRAKGFYIADGASSNYIQTMLSLSSSLNMNYIQSLKADGTDIENRGDLISILENSKVRNVLAQNGYKTVSFRNEYKATFPNADIYYDDSETGLMYPVTAFESILIDHTLARVLTVLPAFHKALIEMPYDTHRHYILSSFSMLQETPTLDGDYFIYAHIIAPHPPFVFDEKGVPLPHNEPFKLADANHFIKDHSRKAYITGYRQQMQYINTLVLETVDEILAKSKTPPVIIIQGDHGPGAYLHWGSLEKTLPGERFSILNAYYFPDQDYSRLYPSISPINSFRVLLDKYFGGNYELLPDRHYYSPWGYPFDFTEVKDVSLQTLKSQLEKK